MARFNRPSTGTKTTNLAQGPAYKESPKLEVASILLTSFAMDQFYRSADSTFDRLGELIPKAGPEFVAKAALYARHEFGMRSITHVAAGELMHQVKGEVWTKDFIANVVRRPDDATEILSYYLNTYGKPIPNALKKGLGLALSKFDDYALAKYRGSNKSVKLVDLVNLTHVHPTASLDKLMKGTLRAPDTWEVKLSQAGQSKNKGEQKAKAWSDLLSEKKLGYFALLRNLRNIWEQADDATKQLALKQLVDPNRIKKSLVLPFRYQTALKELRSADLPQDRALLNALNRALEISVDNVPSLHGKTLVAVDVSGSMQGRPTEIASLFGAILYKSNDVDLMRFGETARYINPNPQDSIESIAGQLTTEWTGTNFEAIFALASHQQRKYDRVIILSDMQAWRGVDSWYAVEPANVWFAKYKHNTRTDPFVYSWDLDAYGSLQFPERNVFALAGFSEKVFDIMKLLETDREAMVHEIENYSLERRAA